MIPMMPEKRRQGRPTKKTESMVSKIFELSKQGKTIKDISEIVGLSRNTIRHWKNHDFEFSCTLKEHEQEANQLVEAALFKRATGYDATVETQRIDKDGNVIDVKETVHIPGHPTAQIYWTKNRDRERWTDRTESEFVGKDGGPLVLEVVDYRGKGDKE